MKFRWSEWLTAAALIFAFSAFAGADIAHDAAPEQLLLREALGTGSSPREAGDPGLRERAPGFPVPPPFFFGHAPRHRHRCRRPKNTPPPDRRFSRPPGRRCGILAATSAPGLRRAGPPSPAADRDP